jgi:hypothetical protein
LRNEIKKKKNLKTPFLGISSPFFSVKSGENSSLKKTLITHMIPFEKERSNAEKQDEP